MTKKPKIFSTKASSRIERPLAVFQSETAGVAYQPLSTLGEAKEFEDGIVILQGDDGGQIYVVIKATDVKCSTETLETLLVDLDKIAWPGNDANARHIYYERRSLGSTIAGEMGGGCVSEAPWIHKNFAELVPTILAVLRGERASIQ